MYPSSARSLMIREASGCGHWAKRICCFSWAFFRAADGFSSLVFIVALPLSPSQKILKECFSDAKGVVTGSCDASQAVGCLPKRCLAGCWSVAGLVGRLEWFECEADFGEVSKTLGFRRKSVVAAPWWRHRYFGSSMQFPNASPPGVGKVLPVCHFQPFSTRIQYPPL